MLSTSLPSVTKQKFTFAHIAAMGTSSENASDQMGLLCIREEQDRQGLNENDGNVIPVQNAPVKQSEDRSPMPTAPTVVRKESPWKILETAVPVQDEKSSLSLPTPAESSQINENVQKYVSPRPKIGCWKKVDIDVNFKAPNGGKHLEKNTTQEESKAKESNRTVQTGKKTKPINQSKADKEVTKLNSEKVENKKKSRKSPGEPSKSKRTEVGKTPRRPNSQKSNQKSSTKKHKQQKSNNRSTSSHVKNPTGRSPKSKKQQKRKGNNNRKSVHSKSQASKDFTHLKPSAVAQVEYFFSINELVKNVYLRKQMDVEGFLPALIVFNFPSVLSFGIPYYDLLQSISSTSKIIEVDMENDCLRLKGGEENYKKWLFPNQDGSFGCPKWIKHKDSLDNDQTEITGEEDLKEDVKIIVEMDESEESLLGGKEKQHCKSSLPDLAMTDSDTDQTSTDSDSQ